MGSFTPSNSIRLQCVGEDDPGGVVGSFYDLYMAKDDGAFFLFQERIDTNFFWFTGEAGATYRFYSRATDHVGNQEGSKFEKETSTTLGVENFITVISPTTEDQHCPGDTVLIDWTGMYAGNGFDLAISFDGGQAFIPITENVDSLANPFAYVLPAATAATEAAVIQIKNREAEQIIGTSSPFPVLPRPPVALGPDLQLAEGESIDLMPWSKMNPFPTSGLRGKRPPPFLLVISTSIL